MPINKYSCYLKNNLASIFLLLFYFSEAFSKYLIYSGNGKSDFPRFIKSGVLILVFVLLLKYWKDLMLPLVLLLMFTVGQFFLIDGFKVEIIVSATKFLFPVFLFIYFNKNRVPHKSKEILFFIFETILIFNGVLILLGLIFDVYWFQSYTGSRFGFNGIFITTASSSYIYTIALFYFLLTLKEKFLIHWKSLFIILCCILTGTKVLYLAIGISLLIYITTFLDISVKKRRILLLTIASLFIVGIYFFFFQYGIFNEIRRKEGLLSSIFSFRDDLFLEQTLPFIERNWTWPNYLFGGISDLATRSQMGFIDVFYFWGILGGSVYLYLYYKTFKTFPLNKILLYMLLSLVLMVFLAGNFFENASLAIYMLILKEAIISSTKTFSKTQLNAEDKHS